MSTPKKLQTAQIAWINHDWADHPADGLTPRRMAMLLRDAEQGDIAAQADLFSDVEERDLHIQSELGKRRLAVSMLPWSISPVADATPAEKDIAKRLQAILESIEELPQLVHDLTDAIGKGFSAVEIEWGRRADGLWIPRRFHHREQRLFRLHRVAGTDELRLNDASATGLPLQELGWIVHRSASRSGSMARTSLFRSLVWAYLPKAYALADWSEFLEVYGYPIRLGKYGPNATEDERNTLLRAVVDIGRRAGGIIPEGMSIDLLNAVTGDPETFQNLVHEQNRYISTLILGGTLTSNADGKSSTNALGNVHNEVRHDLCAADAVRLDGTLTRDLVLAIGQLNGLIVDPLRAPRWKFDASQPEDLGAYADALPKLVGIGMQIDADWAHDRLRIPKAASPQNALRAPTSAPNPNPTQDAPVLQNAHGNFAGAISARADGIAHEEDHDVVLNALENEAGQHLGDWLSQIKSMVERANSMEQLRNTLINSYGDLPTERIAAVMEIAFNLRALQGIADVRQETGIDARPAGGGAAV
jgi:phage gp29-like protein